MYFTPACHFANYLAELFAHYLAYRCHDMSYRSQGFRMPRRPFDQLFCYLLQPVDLENSPHLRSKRASEVECFLP
jgi:exonuclease V gamma subunit